MFTIMLIWRGICLLSIFGSIQFIRAEDPTAIKMRNMGEQMLHLMVDLLFQDPNLECPNDAPEKAKTCINAIMRTPNLQRCKVAKDISMCSFNELLTCKNAKDVIELNLDDANSKLRETGCSPLELNTGNLKSSISVPAKNSNSGRMDLGKQLMEVATEAIFLDPNLQCPEGAQEEAKKCTRSLMNSNIVHYQCKMATAALNCSYSELLTCKNGRAAIESSIAGTNAKLADIGCSPLDLNVILPYSSTGIYIAQFSPPVTILSMLTLVLYYICALL